MAKVKLCRACKKEIDPKATKCPYCQTKQGISARTGCGCLTLVLIGIIFMAAAMNNSMNSPSTPSAPRPNPTATPDALTKLTAVFVGGATKDHIKMLLNESLALYNLPISEEYYHKAGSAMIALRETSNVREIDILTCMIKSHVPNMKLQYHEGAALCATTLSPNTPQPK